MQKIMKKNCVILLASFLTILILNSQLRAQIDTIKNLAIVVPSESISKFINDILPYKIDFGKNFSGSFWIKSIDKIKIAKDRISFSSYIYGKDMEYTAKIGNQLVSVAVGNVNLHNNWETSLRYDQPKKILFIKPHVGDLRKKKDLSQGDMLLNALLVGLSDIEYPIEINKLEPITTEFDNKILTIDMDISNIFTENNKLFIEIKPSAKINSKENRTDKSK